MYISKINLHNFKGFKGDHELVFEPGINFFVGDNNCGKTTIFQAIDFILSKQNPKVVCSKNISLDNDYISVEIELRGDFLRKIINDDELNRNLKKYKIAVLKDQNINSYYMRIRKTSQNDSNKIELLTEAGEYKNLPGVDTTIGALLDIQFVWADIATSEIADFSKTKICGKIISSIVGDIKNDDAWKKFEGAYNRLFCDKSSELRKKLTPLEGMLSNIMTEQYGATSANFSFVMPEPENLIKAGSINLTENGIETPSSEKGNGMQRALAFSLIQVYASINPKDNNPPLIFAIDEPETYMHPRAQNKLLESLEELSSKSQIFITTHSPYLLKGYNPNQHSIHIFSKGNDGFNKTPSLNTGLNLFGDFSPTWGEINFYAFGVPTIELHDELYGRLQEKAIIENDKNKEQKEFDKWLEQKGISRNRIYYHKSSNKEHNYSTTLPTYIRNIVHHPENTKNKKYTNNELRESIELLVEVYKNTQQG